MTVFDYPYQYAIYPNASEKEFIKASKILDDALKEFIKKSILVDVDGSIIQRYETEIHDVILYDDYDLDAVHIRSTYNLDKLFPGKRTKGLG